LPWQRVPRTRLDGKQAGCLGQKTELAKLRDPAPLCVRQEMAANQHQRIRHQGCPRYFYPSHLQPLQRNFVGHTALTCSNHFDQSRGIASANDSRCPDCPIHDMADLGVLGYLNEDSRRLESSAPRAVERLEPLVTREDVTGYQNQVKSVGELGPTLWGRAPKRLRRAPAVSGQRTAGSQWRKASHLPLRQAALQFALHDKTT
jgi:hypothetical protein